METLFETTRINGMTLANRFVFSATWLGLAEEDGSSPTRQADYPNWWGTMPMAVFTFLNSYDFSGKTIVRRNI